MGARHADRLWMIGGAALVIVLVVISWFFVINPKYAEADDLRNETSNTEVQISTLRTRIADLQKQKSKLPQFKAALKVRQDALPSDTGLPDFLRQLQTVGDDLDVTVGGISVSGASLATGFTTVWQLPITLTAEGSAEDLGKFLVSLQQTQPRAVLIDSATVTTQTTDDAADDSSAVTISLAMRVYVSMPAGAGAPSITTTTK